MRKTRLLTVVGLIGIGLLFISSNGSVVPAQTDCKLCYYESKSYTQGASMCIMGGFISPSTGRPFVGRYLATCVDGLNGYEWQLVMKKDQFIPCDSAVE